MTSQFSDTTSTLNFFYVALFLLSILVSGPILMSISVRVLDYDNFLLQGIDQKSGNRKYPRLSFAQYLETETSYGYQIWHKCLS